MPAHTGPFCWPTPPGLISHVQLSDNTVAQRGPTYRDDSIDRSVPGEGELPLADILAAVPDGVVIGLEVPMRSAARAGVSTEERTRRCVEATRALLEQE